MKRTECQQKLLTMSTHQKQFQVSLGFIVLWPIKTIKTFQMSNFIMCVLHQGVFETMSITWPASQLWAQHQLSHTLSGMVFSLTNFSTMVYLTKCHI